MNPLGIALAAEPEIDPVRRSGRNLEERAVPGPNAHQRWYQARNHLDGRFMGPVRIVFNYLVVYSAKHLPSLTLKRWLFTKVLGMKIGERATIASGATLDYFFPELIDLGACCIIGMDSMILTHEFLHDRLRWGPVVVGAGALVGARSLVLAGTNIGAGATVAAGSVVTRPVAAQTTVAGAPARQIGNLR